MFNYPFPSPPVCYKNYKFDFSLSTINKVLFQTVFIGYKVHGLLHLVCNGIILPVCCFLTMFIAYKSLRVAWKKHVRRFETSFMCWAFVEIVAMQIFSTSFAIFYWTSGEVSKEDEYGTTKFTCIFFLYFFNYLPSFCFNLVNCTISMLLLLYYRKWHPTFCGIKLTKFNLRTMYIIITNGALLDVLFIFCISWITMAKSQEIKNYQQKCFLLLNPIFLRFKLVNWVKAMEWETQIFSHTIPYIFSIFYMAFALFKIFNYHMYRRKGKGIQLEEKQHYGGVVMTLGATVIFLAMDSLFNLFCDIYEITLHYTTEPTDANFFFMLKNVKTIMRTIYYIISPFQLLALCSLNPHFQSTMIRYLNGTSHFQVVTLRTLGGNTITKVVYEDYPLPSKMTLLGWCYYKWCRFHCAVWAFRRFLNLVEKSQRNSRLRKRQKKLDKEIYEEKRRNDWKKSEKH